MKEESKTSIFKKYRETMQHQHGWQVELECSKCAWSGIPVYNGWKPGLAMNFGQKPTIYADLNCPECGSELKNEAGKKLVELFTEISITGINKRLLIGFIAILIGLLSILGVGIYVGIHFGWWGRSAFTGLALLPALIGPMIIYFNYKIASIRKNCQCGKPDYIFMGLLGRTSCYRCSSCGKLLRVRD